MTETPNKARPLSPHIGIWKWGPAMTVSIVHRATGTGLTIGMLFFCWWLGALASGPAGYAAFLDVFTYQSGKLNVIGWIVGVGLTLTLFQHMASGVRHLFMDAGDNFELRANKTTAWLTFGFAIVATAAFWTALLLETPHV
ncbi:succinate dehydrogenase, cytochrome b556 subunit [Sphingomonas sp. LB-2]|uniref:succinate dehydrogenase, cytochrome b556 subunit n=1 Tax=Sphingomonas caeni TaxID=2984949 RepID=UPI002231B24D|nr:succinate dehydrogenase, cytochrome b556 subunit [Sphingomonas caeni]MCW3847239.1 succinate dehydrogenase, cytochrome b556 subunit [Sphingomonas caeni]